MEYELTDQGDITSNGLSSSALSEDVMQRHDAASVDIDQKSNGDGKLESSSSTRHNSPVRSPSLCSISQVSSGVVSSSMLSININESKQSLTGDAEQANISCNRNDDALDESIEDRLLENNHDVAVVDFRYTNAPRLVRRSDNQQNIIVLLVYAVSYAVVSLIILGPVLSIVIAIVPLGYIVKCVLANFCMCNSGPKCIAFSNSERVKSPDLYWLWNPPSAECIVQTVILVRGNIHKEQLIELMQNDLILPYRHQKPFQRFYQRLYTLMCGYAWQADENFEFERHIFDMPDHVLDKESLEQYLGELGRTGMGRDKALWEIQVCSYFGGRDHSLIVLRYNPCMIDGVTFMHILCNELSENQDLTFFCSKQHMSAPLYTINLCRTFLSGALVFMQRLLRKRKRNYFNQKKLSGVRTISFSEKLSMEAVQRVRQVTRCTFSEILLCSLSGAIRLYLQSLGADNPCDIRTILPIDLHANYETTKRVNKTVFVPFTLPVSTEGAIPRLWDIKSRMENLRNSSEAVVLLSAWKILMAVLPLAVCRRVFWMIHSKSTCVISNLPGPNQHVQLQSLPIRSVLHHVTPIDGLGFSVSFTSYADEVHMTVVADKNVLPDPAKLNNLFCSQFVQLSDLLSCRRIPGDTLVRHIDIPAQMANCPEVQEAQLRLNHIQNKLQDVKMRLMAVSSGESDEDEAALSLKFRALRNEFQTVVGHLKQLQVNQCSPDAVSNIVRLSLRSQEEDIESRFKELKMIFISLRRQRREASDTLQNQPSDASTDSLDDILPVDSSGWCDGTSPPFVSLTRPLPVLTSENRATLASTQVVPDTWQVSPCRTSDEQCPMGSPLSISPEMSRTSSPVSHSVYVNSCKNGTVDELPSLPSSPNGATLRHVQQMMDDHCLSPQVET